ncbi:MAG: diacylglycerol/lipid kinase family protein [Acidimicrobiales bacterium]
MQWPNASLRGVYGWQVSTVHLLTNPTARVGKAADSVAAIRRALTALGAEVVDITGATPDETSVNLSRAVAEEAERVVIAGGDGLVHLAVQSLARSSTIAGICPVGTGNDFANALGIPTDVDEAVTNALGDPTELDLMQVGTTWAASVATAGFSVEVNKKANAMRFPRGASRYTVATLLELRGLSARQYRIVVDGQETEVEAALITVANTAFFGGGMEVTPGASPTDGLLDVTVVADVGRIELLTWFRKVFSGRHLEHDAVSTFRGRSVQLQSETIEVWADGEPVSDHQTTIEAVPEALQVAGVTLPT